MTRCLCPRIGEAHQGEVLCHPPVDMAAAVPSGTYCLHTCHGHTKTEMMCQHSLWSTSPASLSCEGTNSSSAPAPLRTISPRGKSLQLSQARPVTLRDQMGALADIKIAEMKTKDIFAKPMMKTKVRWSQLVSVGQFNVLLTNNSWYFLVLNKAPRHTGRSARSNVEIFCIHY